VPNLKHFFLNNI